MRRREVNNWTPVLPRKPPPSRKPGQFEYACAVDRIMAGIGGDFTLEVSTTAAEGMGNPCDGGMVLTQGSSEIDFDDSGILGVRPLPPFCEPTAESTTGGCRGSATGPFGAAPATASRSRLTSSARNQTLTSSSTSLFKQERQPCCSPCRLLTYGFCAQRVRRARLELSGAG